MKKLLRLGILLTILPLLPAAQAQSSYFWGNFVGLPDPTAPGSKDGTGAGALFNVPTGAALDASGNLYVTDQINNTIRKVTPAGVVSTFAGTAGQSGSTNGTGSAARFNYPCGAAVDKNGNVFVSDTNNNTIRKITPSGVVSTFAGTAGQSGSTNGTGSAARFSSPLGVAVDANGNVYVADEGNDTIRKITPAGVVSTFAGTAGQSGSTNGTGSAARFNTPSGVAVDSAGNVWVAGGFDNAIRKITPGGVVSTFAGTPGQTGSTDGTGSAARFYFPAGLALDAAGNIYVTDSVNFNIRKITPAGVVSTIGGSTVGTPGLENGLGTAALFGYTSPSQISNGPQEIAVSPDGSTVYVADAGNNRISKGTTTAGWHSIVVGSSANAAAGIRTGVASPSQNLYFYKGTDKNIWAVFLSSGQWVQQQLSTNANVSDWLAYEPNYGILCYQGTDSKLWCVYYNTTTAKWTSLQLGTPPQGVTVASDVVVDSSGGWNNIYYRGSDSHMYAAYFNGSAWVHVGLGGTATVEGNLAVEGNNHLIYYKGSDNNLWCFYNTGKAWEQLQLSTTANVGGAVAVDNQGLLAYYKSINDDSAWCTYPNSSGIWNPVQLDAAANMSATGTTGNIAPYTANDCTLYLDANGQADSLYWNGSKWTHTILGDGGWNLTDGLSLQPVNHWAFTRRSDGHVVLFYID